MRIETERLIITEFTPEMAADVRENSQDEDTRRFVPDEVFETVEEAGETIAFLMNQYGGTDGPLAYPVLLKGDGTNIGYVQIVPIGDRNWEIGYHIAKKHTGNGYATEAVKAFLPVMMNHLGIDRVHGICLSENAASRHVLAKCGFEPVFEGVGDYQGEKRRVFRSLRQEKTSWIEGNYRRNLLDMHIDDWNESFLSRLNPEEYVSCLKEAGVQAAMVKARSHTGLNYWPGPNGRMHRGLKGRDFVGEMVRLCHREGIAVVLYYSQIFDNLAYAEHPEWRLVTPEGISFRDFRGKDCFRNGRYGICCPNQPGYRAYVREALQDLASRYGAEGFFLDMAFWTDICCCDACTARWKQESGLAIPRTIDWDDPDFRRFAEARQRWLREFAEASTRAIRDVRPEATVEHQYSMISQPWLWGVTEKQALASDFCSGDYYGGYLQQSFINKYYRNVSRRLPFCYHTGRCDPELAFHTTTKSEEQLVLHAGTALLHGGAFLLVDAINPDGSIQPEIYRKLMKRVYDQTRPFEPFAGGNLQTEAGIWFASEAKFDPRESGTPVAEAPRGTSVYAEAPLGMTRILRDAHIPFDILGSGNLRDYAGKLIVLPHVAAVTDEEMDALEAYVSRGGSLYVSGPVSHPRLARLLGVETTGQTEETFTYLAPADHPDWMADFSPGAPLTWAGRQWTGRLLSADTEVLARTVLPWTMPGSEHFAAIHSNPPGKKTDLPAMTLRRVGESLLLWVSAPLEMNQPYLSRKLVEGLVRRLIGKEMPGTDAPRFVEMLRWEKDGKHYLALINEQEESPVAPVRGIHVTVPGFRAAVLLPEGLPLPTEADEAGLRIELKELKLFAVMELIP